MKNTLKRIIVIFLMKGCNLINTIFLMLCVSCTDRDSGYKGFFKYFSENFEHLEESWKEWLPLYLGAAACAVFMSIYGGIYVFRNGWRSLIPKSWRKTDN